GPFEPSGSKQERGGTGRTCCKLRASRSGEVNSRLHLDRRQKDSQEWLSHQGGLKGDLAGKLDDSGTRAEIELRAQGPLKRRGWRPQADGHTGSTVCPPGGELGGAHQSIVCAVEGVVGFQDELRLDALMDRDVLSDSGIQRNEVGKVERVAAESRGTVRAAVAVCIQIRVDHAGVGLSGLCSQNPAELPSASKVAPRTAQRMCVAVEVPNRA